jgi:hypothetical protein
MTTQEKERLRMVEERTARIEEKLDNLPDTIIRRLDDRYVTKDALAKVEDNFDAKYLTSGQARLVVGVFSFIIAILTIVDWYLNARGK